MVITACLGQAVVTGKPIGWIHGGVVSRELRSADEVAGMVDVSGTRELALNTEYGLVALVDIAIMALSPAVNDPNTAVEVIETLSFLFPEIAEVPLGPYAITEPESPPGVIVSMRTFGELVELATTQILLYGLSEPMVAAALREFADTLQLLDLDAPDRIHVEAFAEQVA